MSSGMCPEAMSDPGNMMAYAGQNASRWRSMSFLGMLTAVAAVFYFPGLAARLRARTPSRATGVLYFGILGIGGHGLGAALQWAGDPLVAGATDKVAAGQAWLALNAVHAGLETFGSLGTGLVMLLAGWAAMNSKAFGPGVAWVGLVGGTRTLRAFLRPPGPPLLLLLLLSLLLLAWV